MLPKPAYMAGSAYHTQRRVFQSSTIRCLEIAMTLLGAPSSVLDVGCGEGALVGWCRNKNIDVLGVDLAVPAIGSGWGLLHHDLRTSLFLDRTFEWVLCWEVAEHLEPESADTLCDTLARHLERPFGRLLFTAAVPGQRGPGHINTMPLEYWRGLFEARGLHWQAEESAMLRKVWLAEVPRAPWYGRNIQSFAWN